MISSVILKNIRVWVEDPVAYLYAKDTKDDKECATNKDDVADRLEGSDERLHHQLQSWSSAYHSKERWYYSNI